MKKLTDNIKGVLIVMLVVMLTLISAMRLMEIQVVGDEDIKAPEKQYGPDAVTFVKQVKATRGRIIDYSGNIIVDNDPRCDLVLRKAFFPEDLQKGNAAILGIYNALKEYGYEYKETSLPISFTKPYVFTEKDTAELVSELNLNVYATAENCIDKLIADYKISDNYTDEEKRIIAGIRYEMTAKDFSNETDLLLAEDVDPETVAEMKELSNFYGGIDVIEVCDRQIQRGDILPHEIGTIGPIYAEQYDELKTRGYAMNDVVGKSGIEEAMETELRGQNGQEEITVVDGSVVDSRTIVETESGHTVKLTVDGNYQLKLQSILDNFLENFSSINTVSTIDSSKVKCGAITVIDCKTGAVKGMATAPTYNLKDYSENYDYFLNAEDVPLLNRCKNGLYRPGSTFKTITATAGLNEGIITGSTTFNCQHDFKYHGGDFSCTGWHGNISVRKAIEVSCNVFFYELSDRLGIDMISKYATLYGLGQSTGLETGDSAGYLCNPETFAANNIPWYIGYVIQAGIGNQDAGMTPLQMAVVASTIGNRGVRYKPYLVDSLYDYGTGDLVSKTQPTIAEEIPLNYEGIYDYIIAGMVDASHNVPEKYSLSNLGFDVAIKTGTPQTGATLDEQNSFFIGFAPADDPEIAFAGVIENGEFSKYMIRDIILAYQECYGLNGVAPKKQSLPKEERKPLPNATGTTTETTTTTSTTTTTTTTLPASTSTQPVQVPQQPVNTEATQPATVRTEPVQTEPPTVPTEPPTETTAPPPPAPEPDVPQEPGQVQEPE